MLARSRAGEAEIGKHRPHQWEYARILAPSAPSARGLLFVRGTDGDSHAGRGGTQPIASRTPRAISSSGALRGRVASEKVS
jgi:hypothetical protein